MQSSEKIKERKKRDRKVGSVPPKNVPLTQKDGSRPRKGEKYTCAFFMGSFLGTADNSHRIEERQAVRREGREGHKEQSIFDLLVGVPLRYKSLWKEGHSDFYDRRREEAGISVKVNV